MLWRRNVRKKTDFENNPFSADDPINRIFEDKLGYNKRAEEIIKFLKISNFKKSFTVGIVGPWGNGKSSLIEMMQHQLAEQSLHETIHLKFLPYLNHSESDIISEFFKQLSNELNKHSGKLANYLVDYSEKLLKLYKNKSIKDFIAPNSSILGSRNTSLDFYFKINEVLESIDKKFIIFIDDLDRLSSKEVLQVLKLVRNTANFRNFIFVIALDKDYVLNTLISKNDISDHTFVDKFFQLEVYLPEIDKVQLKTDFLDILKNSGLKGEHKFLDGVQSAIYKTNNLFDDYITNHRGAKRLVNQLVFDHKMLPDELDESDFLNFTYLKLAFPAAIKYLNSNWQTILPYDPQSKLRELRKSEPGSEIGTYDIMRNIRLFDGTSRFNPNLKDYEVTSGIKENEEFANTQLSSRQNALLGKTLIALFGKENNKPQHTSIKFGNNLKKLLQQKINENELTQSEFKAIISSKDNYTTLENSLQVGKTQELLDRFSYYTSESQEETKAITLILLHIFNKAEFYGTHSIHTLQVLGDFIKENISTDDELAGEQAVVVWQNIESQFLDNKNYERYRKLEFLAFLSQYRVGLDFSSWGTNEDALKDLSLKIYKEYLEDKTGELWGITDYSFYHAYHNVNKLHISAAINPLIQDFWLNNDIKILCAQTTQNDAWTIKTLKTSDHASTIFNTKDDYKKFIFKKIEETDDLALKEYKTFLELEYFSNFSSHIRFDFKYFTEINEKLLKVKTDNRMLSDEFDEVIEVFVEAMSNEAHSATYTNVDRSIVNGFINNTYYRKDDRFFTKFRITTAEANTFKTKFLEHYKRMIGSEEYVINDSKKTIEKDGETIIKFISVQPKDYDY